MAACVGAVADAFVEVMNCCSVQTRDVSKAAADPFDETMSTHPRGPDSSGGVLACRTAPPTGGGDDWDVRRKLPSKWPAQRAPTAAAVDSKFDF